MKLNRDYVLARLRKLKEQYCGYFGTDLLNLARELKVTLRPSGSNGEISGAKDL